MPRYDFEVPRPRGLISANDCPVSEEIKTYCVKDFILHMLLARVTTEGGDTVEFETIFNPVVNALEIDAPDEILEAIESINVGPNLQRFLDWLNNVSDQFSIIDTDLGTWGAGLVLRQVDDTAYENAWTMIRQTNGHGAGDGSLRFTYGTNAAGHLNPLVIYFGSAGTLGIGRIPAAGVELDAGITRFGDSTTNYTTFSATGDLTLVGTARVERHICIGAASWQGGVAGPTASFEGVFSTLDFDAASDDEAH